MAAPNIPLVRVCEKCHRTKPEDQFLPINPNIKRRRNKKPLPYASHLDSWHISECYFTKRCLSCRTISYCVHGRQGTNCKECKAAKICRHGLLRYTCKRCGLMGTCQHKMRRFDCPDCCLCSHDIPLKGCDSCLLARFIAMAEEVAEIFSYLPSLAGRHELEIHLELDVWDPWLYTFPSLTGRG